MHAEYPRRRSSPYPGAANNLQVRDPGTTNTFQLRPADSRLTFRSATDSTVMEFGTSSYMYVNADMSIGGGAASYDGNAESIIPNAQSASWAYGIANTSQEEDSYFFIDSNLPPYDNRVFHIEHDGQVGLGTESPTERLDIEGNLRVRDSTSGSVLRLNSYGSYPELGVEGDNLLISGDSGWIMTVNDNNQNVGIGSLGPSSSYKLHVAGTARVATLSISSDERLKDNIETIDGALDKVNALRGVTFDWRREEHPDEGFPEGKQVGLIAQEVERVLPELVITEKEGEGYKSVEYPNLVAVLIEAVKELRQQNEALNSRLEVLEGLSTR